MAYTLLRASGADSGLVVPADIGSTRDEVAHVLCRVKLRRTAFKRVGREVLASGTGPNKQLAETYIGSVVSRQKTLQSADTERNA